MPTQEHSTPREGVATGLLGAVATAVWYFVWDLAAGRPLHTFNTLGRIFFQADLNPGARAIDPGAVVGFLALHVVVFLVLGIALTQVTHLAARNPALRMGVWLGLVIALLFATGLTYMLNLSTADRLPLAEVIGGGALGVGVMAWHLWRRHPRLGRSFDEAPLGDEVRTPPHAPGGPRV